MGYNDDRLITLDSQVAVATVLRHGFFRESVLLRHEPGSGGCRYSHPSGLESAFLNYHYYFGIVDF